MRRGLRGSRKTGSSSTVGPGFGSMSCCNAMSRRAPAQRATRAGDEGDVRGDETKGDKTDRPAAPLVRAALGDIGLGHMESRAAAHLGSGPFISRRQGLFRARSGDADLDERKSVDDWEGGDGRRPHAASNRRHLLSQPFQGMRGSFKPNGYERFGKARLGRACMSHGCHSVAGSTLSSSRVENTGFCRRSIISSACTGRRSHIR